MWRAVKALRAVTDMGERNICLSRTLLLIQYTVASAVLKLDCTKTRDGGHARLCSHDRAADSSDGQTWIDVVMNRPVAVVCLYSSIRHVECGETRDTSISVRETDHSKLVALLILRRSTRKSRTQTRPHRQILSLKHIEAITTHAHSQTIHALF